MEIIRSKRKTLSMQINDEGSLIIKAPFFMDKADIENFIERNQNWIHKRKNIIEKRKSFAKPKEFIDGEKFLFLGDEYSLKLVDRLKEGLTLEKEFLFAKNKLYKARDVFINWYKSEAIGVIKDRVDYYTGITGDSYSKIKINSAQGRWGSCSGKGNLNFSWRLILAPFEVVDYVVVHEVAHIKVRNHSKMFWQRVESLMPEYRKHKRWLKDNGWMLNV